MTIETMKIQKTSENISIFLIEDKSNILSFLTIILKKKDISLVYNIYYLLNFSKSIIY